MQDRQTKKFRLNIKNWECGVIMPIKTNKPLSVINAESNSEHGVPTWKIFKEVVPLPCLLPGFEGAGSLAYGASRPWFFMGDS